MILLVDLSADLQVCVVASLLLCFLQLGSTRRQQGRRAASLCDPVRLSATALRILELEKVASAQTSAH